MTRAGWLVGLSLLLAAADAQAKGCHEVSEIVGKQHCSRFGSFWDVSRSQAWVVGFGLSVSHFPVTGARFTGSVEETLKYALPFYVNGDSLGQWTSITPTLRVAVFPWRVFYVGVEGQVGAGVTSDAHPVAISTTPGKPAAPVEPALGVHATGFTAQSLGAIAGVSVPVGPFDLSLEVLGGFRSLSPGLDWNRPTAAYAATGGCTTGPGAAPSCPLVNTDYTLVPRVEPRAGVALRVYPWITLRALVGFDVLAGGAPSVTALVEVHTRTYDGFYPRRRAPAGD